MKLNLFFIFLFILNLANAEDSKIPCRYKDGSLGLNEISTFDCKLAENISSNSEIKKEFKKHVDKKLAEKLGKKASDVIEDISLLDSYFDNNGIGIGDNERVRTSCQLPKIAKPECRIKITKEQYDYKMKTLQGTSKYLPSNKDVNNSFYQKMVAKAQELRSVKKLEDIKTCPLRGDSGLFILNAQISNVDADKIISDLKLGRTTSLTPLYDLYPQMNLLKSNELLKKKFESSMASFEGVAGTEKIFFDNFFKRIDVQSEMAVSLAAKCDNLAESVKKFICEDDFPHLAMKTDDRDIFLDEKEDEIFKEISRGLSCAMEEKHTDESLDNPFNAKGNITDKISFYEKGVRNPETENKIERSLGMFCSAYQCKDDKYKEMKSCMNGGPVTSMDIIQSCTGQVASGCNEADQKHISYLISLETDAKNFGVKINGLASSSQSTTTPDGTSEKPRGFSAFYQNFLGVEGTLAAEGKKITPITIAEKKAEFVEKKLDIVANSASLSQSREGMKVENVRQESISAVADDVGIVETVASKDSDQFRRSFQSTQFSKANYEIGKDGNGKAKKVKFTDTDSSTIDEMKKLRTELADAIGKVKGSDDERLAAIADNNAVAITPKGSSSNPIKNLSSAEKDRLDSYRDNLNSWENRLRTWQNNLSDRDVVANSRSGSGSEARAEAPATSADQSNAINGSGNAIKLSKSSAAAGTSGLKADATGGERAPGTEKVEGEAGVVNSENLATLGKDSLKELGITSTDSFIIKVRHKEKIYSVPVKTLTYSGKSMFVPLLNEKDRELSKIVFESPLFKDYRSYQLERQYKLDKK